MDISLILKNLDDAFNEADTGRAEAILTGGIKESLDEGDDGALLQLLNEYLGFLRETGRAEESYEIADKIRELALRMGLEGSIPYATSILNIANAYRAGGRTEESLMCYDEVEGIYETSLPADSMLFASFYNNKSLLYQEIGEWYNAAACLRKALSIVEAKGEPFEIAVSHANLANTALGMGDYATAKLEAGKAIEIFKETGTLDSHYASALYALGLAHVRQADTEKGREYLTEALSIMERFLGKNEFYYRIKDELDSIKETKAHVKGLEIARKFCETCFVPKLKEKYSGYMDRIAMGLIGRGSDCYGYDDVLSGDHDYGPAFCVFVSKETYDEIGAGLEELYNSLPDEFMGVKTAPKVSKSKRRGVFVIEDFFKDLLGIYPLKPDDYLAVPEYALSAALNGELFADPEGKVTAIRDEIATVPEFVTYLKLAQHFSEFSQTAQYNYTRFLQRNDRLTASIMLADGLKAAMKIAHILDGKFIPHDKWLARSCEDLSFGSEFTGLLHSATDPAGVSKLSVFLAARAYEKGFISDTDDYLDHHAEELLFKSDASKAGNDELVKRIARTEFDAFDKVKNEGGRASCQNDWYTFSIMRESQYMTWTRPMLLQYLYDFTRELSYGHNLITEKYGRMMESTAPEKYAEIKDNFPVIPDDKKAIIEAVVGIQVNWMHEFADEFPKLGSRARSVDTFDDNAGNTSFETYLRGEISTYSDKMLQLYAGFIADLAGRGINLTRLTMDNSVKLYGYESLEAAEEKA